MNVPKLRFKEFKNDWSPKNLSEVVAFSKGNSLSKSDLDEQGSYPCILYGELYTKYHEVIRKVFSKTNYISDNIVKSKYGDILIPASGETPIDISTSSCILLDNVLLGGDINILSLKNCDGRFISYMISNNKRKTIARVAQGHSIVHLYNENLKKVNLDIPLLSEQKKIADMLELLDKKIELQTKKIEALKLFKKGLLNEFLKHNPCSKISLKYILKERKNYTIKDGILPHVTLSKNGIEEKTERYNRDFLVKSKDKNYKITKIYDLCYNPANLKFGVICLNTYGSAIFSPIYVTFEINHKFNPLYIGYYVTQQNFINSARKYEQGTVYERMAVAPEDFLKMNIWVPNKHIQDKFSTILISMDTKLKKEKEKLKNLEALKKGFMQSMFV